jgi:hypothetical protein
METTALRKELHSFIDMLPMSKIRALMPLVSCMVDEPFVYETDLTGEEHKVCEESWNRYNEHPEDFILWSDYKKDRGL